VRPTHAASNARHLWDFTKSMASNGVARAQCVRGLGMGVKSPLSFTRRFTRSSVILLATALLDESRKGGLHGFTGRNSSANQQVKLVGGIVQDGIQGCQRFRGSDLPVGPAGSTGTRHIQGTGSSPGRSLLTRSVVRTTTEGKTGPPCCNHELAQIRGCQRSVWRSLRCSYSDTRASISTC
jgi:hypothetical protein